MAPLAIGVDVGGTQIRAALIAADGGVLARHAVPTPAKEGATAVVAKIAEAAAIVTGVSSIVGIGLSAPGPLDAERGVALATPTITGFVDFPLVEAVQAATNRPVVLENDAIAAAIGEWRFGAGRGLANMVYVTVSTGIGGGVVADGRVLRGRKGMAAHIGHMTMMRGGELCACGHRGCFEAYASGTAFLARARRRASVETRSALYGSSRDLSGAAVFAAEEAGDALARELVAEEAEMLGLGFASLLHLYSPDVLVMGGGMSVQFEALHLGISAAIGRAAMPPFRDVPIRPAALGDNSGLVGAAALAIERFGSATL